MFPITASSDGVSFMLPITPTKWTGTRTAALSSTFASHRPLSLTVSWEPMVGTNTAGSVAVGTVFAGARLPLASDSFTDISVQLASTNGGFVSTIWDHHTSRIQLGKNLRANQFPLYSVNTDDIPLWVLVATSVTTGTIGYLIVDAEFTLRNPITAQQAPPITSAGTSTFTHSDEAGTTQMSVPESAFNRPLTAGQEVVMTFARAIKNLSGGVLAGVLSPLVASYSSTSSGNYLFDVDSNIASQSALGYTIGMHENF